ncbi:MAG: hypothetical protein A2W80_04675 [Candidatus Riflebacteria bacterium GWC2_50_8]|nr:MAG: hypothetical protein A2W80_04675 [Candidatus Riflebacteria bacterium GWC2_50_8]
MEEGTQLYMFLIMKLILAMVVFFAMAAYAQTDLIELCKSPDALKRRQIPAAIMLANDINACDESGSTALMYARSPEIIEALVKAGANVDARDKDGMTAMRYAKSPEIVEALVKAGADVNASNNDGYTALIYQASLCENPAIISTLLNAGANPKLKTNCGCTAFDQAKKQQIYC